MAKDTQAFITRGRASFTAASNVMLHPFSVSYEGNGCVRRSGLNRPALQFGGIFPLFEPIKSEFV
jgi:hypothetical protein